MRLNRILCEGPLATGAEIRLPAASAHHVAKVLRMRPGAALGVFDGAGNEYAAQIVRIEGNAVTARLGDRIVSAGESPLRITLVQGVSRSERMDWTLQKATELGVSAIAPVLTARSVVRLDDKQAQKKQQHWRGIVIGACEQCGRATLPSIAAPVPLRDYLSAALGNALRLVLSPSASTSLAGIANVATDIELLIGPEGGLDDDELAAAQRAGFTPARLGPRVLRTETAAIVALAVLQASHGDLQ
jgi:16S rRNA (uracil1498-N3)-methyltransferase